MKQKHLLAYLLVALALIPFVAKTASSQGGATVVFTTEKAEIRYKHIELTISGPDTFHWEGIFEAGETPSIGIVLPDGTVLPDGQFTYELRYVPQLSAETLEIMAIAQNNAERAELEAELRASGAIPPTRIETGAFLIENGMLVGAEDAREPNGTNHPNPNTRDQVIADDHIVIGSQCVGQDCVNGESFGFDTIRLKENNLRIKFQDTSSTGSFPSNDWQITINDTTNGGQNRFSIDDIDGGRTPFTIEASAPSHSLYVDDGGRIGLGTSTPVVELHVVDGDSPTLRLEQDGSSGFTAQTWDIASNEANFFIRDVTNGSALSFRIQPGADQNSLFIENTNEVGLGTASPDARLHVIGNALFSPNGDPGALASQASLHVYGTDGTTALKVEDTASSFVPQFLLKLANKGPAAFSMSNTNSGTTWSVVANSSFILSRDGSGLQQFSVNASGDLVLSGNLTVSGAGGCTGCSLGNNFSDVDVLAQLKNLPISMWSSPFMMESFAEGKEAQLETLTRNSLQPDVAAFNKAFGLGFDLKHIAPLDVATVALAASQELAIQAEAQDARITELEAQNNDLAQRVAELEALVEAMLEAGQ